LTQSLFSADRAPRLWQAEECLSPLPYTYFSELLQSIFLHDLDSECKPVMLTSPTSGAGVSFICSYIGTDLVRLGYKVLLAEAQTLLRLTHTPPDEVIAKAERIDMSRLWVLGHKQIEKQVINERAARSSISSVVNSLREGFTHIIVDAPALSASDDALTLATAVHGIILVAQQKGTAKNEIVRTHQRFASLGGRVLGTIYNARSTDTIGGNRP
jgi:Mrp family chromosome partitioning ATPase